METTHSVPLKGKVPRYIDHIECQAQSCNARLYKRIGWEPTAGQTRWVKLDGSWYCPVHAQAAKKSRDIELLDKTWGEVVRQIEEAARIANQPTQCVPLKGKDKRCACIQDLIAHGYAQELHGLIVLTLGLHEANSYFECKLEQKHVSFCPMCGKGLN